MWKTWRPFVYGKAPPGSREQHSANESSGPYQTLHQGQSNAPSRVPTSSFNRSSSQPYHAPAGGNNRRGGDFRSNPSVGSNSMRRRPSSPRNRKPATPPSTHLRMTGGIPRGRSDSVHQLRQYVQFEVPEPPSRYQSSMPVVSHQRQNASPASTSDSVTLNGDEDAVFETSDDDDGSEEEDAEGVETEYEVGDGGATSKVQLSAHTTELRDLSNLLRQHYYRTNPVLPADNFSKRQGAIRRRGEENEDKHCSRTMRYVRTGSFSKLERSTRNKTPNSVDPPRGQKLSEGSGMVNRRSMFGHIGRSVQPGHSYSPSQSYTSYRPSSTIARSESSHKQELPRSPDPASLIFPFNGGSLDDASLNVQGAESEEVLRRKIVWLKAQLALKKTELDQLSANVKSKQHNAVDRKLHVPAPRSPYSQQKVWQHMATRLEGEFALKNLEVEKLSATLKSSSNDGEEDAHAGKKLQDPRLSSTGHRILDLPEGPNRTHKSSWKDWGMDPYSRTYSVEESNRQSTISSPTVKSTVTSLFSRIPSGSSFTEDSVSSGSEVGDGEDITEVPKTTVPDVGRNKDEAEEVADGSSGSEVDENKDVIEDLNLTVIDVGVDEDEPVSHFESANTAERITASGSSVVKDSSVLVGPCTLGEQDISVVQEADQISLFHDSRNAESSIGSSVQHGPGLAMPIPVRVFPLSFFSLADAHQPGQAEVPDPTSPKYDDIGDHSGFRAASVDASDSIDGLHFTAMTKLSPDAQLGSPVPPNNSVFDRFNVFLENWVRDNPSFSEVVISEAGTSSSIGMMTLQHPVQASVSPPGSNEICRELPDLSYALPTGNALHLTTFEDPVDLKEYAEEYFDDENYDYFDMSEYFITDDVETRKGSYAVHVVEEDQSDDIIKPVSPLTPGIGPKHQAAKVQFADDASSPPVKRTSAQLLESVLRERPHLNLSGKVKVAYEKPKTWAFGGFADIYQGYYVEAKKHVAVKRLRLNIRASEKVTKDLAKELRIWSELDHPNVLPLLGYISHPGSSYPALVSEWMVEGSLHDCVNDLKRYEAFSMVLGIAKGLAYLHSRDIVHSDLKSDNVLVSPKKQALLTDFGISQMTSLSTGYSSDTVKGSGRWQAMEFFTLREEDDPPPLHTVATDVWAFGMTIYELLSYDLPYSHIKDRDQVTLVISRGYLPKLPPHFATSTGLNKILERTLWSICERCWNRDPNGRPCVSALVGELEAVDRCKDTDGQKYLSKLLDTFRNA